MVITVQSIGASIVNMSRDNEKMGRASKIWRIDDLRVQRYCVALESADTPTGSPQEKVHELFLEEISEQIEKATNDVYGPAASANN